MIAALGLIQVVEAAGGRFKVDGDQLKIFPKGVADLVLEELRQHKEEVIALLTLRSQLPPGVRLVRWEPKIAPVELSRYETVTNTEKFISTTLVQLAAHLNGRNWQAGNWGLRGLIDRLAACGCVCEIEDKRQALQ
jgi:hypothetical protein